MKNAIYLLNHLPNIFHKISLKIRFLFCNMFKGGIVNITKFHS